MRRCTILIVLLSVAGCAGADSATPSGPTASSTVAATSTAAPSPASSAPAELGTIIDSGFGQRDEYVWVTATVRNNSQYVGQTVTVNFNVLDVNGQLLASQAQVEGFSRPGADHILGTQIDLGSGEVAARVEASLNVEPAGAFSDRPFPDVPTANYRVGEDDFGAPEVSFEAMNPLTEPLSSPRIGIVCRDAADAIVGGGSEYPELIPAGGKILVESSVLVSVPPATCSAIVGAPVDWDGQGSGGSTTATAAPSESAEAAFRTWLEQFAAQDWDAQYETLLPAQQKLISAAKYKACRAADVADIKWLKTLSAQEVGPTEVPGTDLKLPATKVTVQVSFNGLKTPVDAHMYVEKGQWRWSMTAENLANCT